MLGGAVGGLARLPDPNQGAQEPSHYSDTTASAPGSDDEGGNALQSPPEDQDPAGSGAGSESGGSVVESITGDANLLGRRSSYEAVDARSSRMSIENIEAAGGAEPEWESANAKLHSLRLLVLDQLVI
jgi:E3 ubiquitin-protein ligase UBR4